MNERIKELAKQSGISILYEYDGYDGHAAVANLADIEKFAKLIVWECMSMCDEHRARYFGYRIAASDFTDKNMWAEGEAVCDALRYKMKKHFGVEE